MCNVWESLWSLAIKWILENGFPQLVTSHWFPVLCDEHLDNNMLVYVCSGFELRIWITIRSLGILGEFCMTHTHSDLHLSVSENLYEVQIGDVQN